MSPSTSNIFGLKCYIPYCKLYNDSNEAGVEVVWMLKLVNSLDKVILPANLVISL